MNTINIQKHFSILGRKAKDKVTGFSGVASSVCFDLYGCVQIAITPAIDKDGKTKDSHWFDIARLEPSGKPVMELPNYEFGPQAEGRQGAAEKPTFDK